MSVMFAGLCRRTSDGGAEEGRRDVVSTVRFGRKHAAVTCRSARVVARSRGRIYCDRLGVVEKCWLGGSSLGCYESPSSKVTS